MERKYKQYIKLAFEWGKHDIPDKQFQEWFKEITKRKKKNEYDSDKNNRTKGYARTRLDDS